MFPATPVQIDVPTGLVQFPVTKLMMVCCVGIALLASLLNMKYLFLLQYDPFVLEYGQFWRYITFQLGSVNESDVAIMTLIWYQFRSLERLWGSRKYLNLIFLSWICTGVIVFLLSNVLNRVLPGVIWDKYTTGPLPILLCLTHFYKQYTPRTYAFNIILNQPFFVKSNVITWRLTDHFYVNGLLFLAMVNQGLVGLLIGLISWICGILLDSGLIPGVDSFKLVPFRDSWNRSPTTFNRASAVTAGNNSVEDPDEQGTEEAQDEPQRNLGVQFLDTFRR